MIWHRLCQTSKIINYFMTSIICLLVYIYKLAKPLEKVEHIAVSTNETNIN